MKVWQMSGPAKTIKIKHRKYRNRIQINFGKKLKQVGNHVSRPTL